MRNNQIPIKQDLASPDMLRVNSIFYTIQGEGPFAGSPSVFIRLSGCNLQCPGCDTEYTEGELCSVGSIVDSVVVAMPVDQVYPFGPLVVITGGEPFRQNIRKLVDQLLDCGMRVQIETNGTLFVDLEWSFAHRNLTIVCSPKGSVVNPKLWPHIKALKYVLDADSQNPDDGLPILALGHGAAQVARPPAGWLGEIYIQPIDVEDVVKNQRHLKAAVAASFKFGYRLCLQVHKIINVP